MTKEKQRNNRKLPKKYRQRKCTNRNRLFGGSFTAIEEERQEELLQVASEFVKSGQVSSIRVSTRPDAIDKNILKRLKNTKLKTIELGVQSFKQLYLKKN